MNSEMQHVAAFWKTINENTIHNTAQLRNINTNIAGVNQQTYINTDAPADNKSITTTYHHCNADLEKIKLAASKLNKSSPTNVLPRPMQCFTLLQDEQAYSTDYADYLDKIKKQLQGKTNKPVNSKLVEFIDNLKKEQDKPKATSPVPVNTGHLPPIPNRPLPPPNVTPLPNSWTNQHPVGFAETQPARVDKGKTQPARVDKKISAHGGKAPVQKRNLEFYQNLACARNIPWKGVRKVDLIKMLKAVKSK